MNDPELEEQLHKALVALHIEEKNRSRVTVAGALFMLRVRYTCNLRALNHRDSKEEIAGIRYMIRNALGDDAKGLAYSSRTDTLILALIDKLRRTQRENAQLRATKVEQSRSVGDP